MLMTRHPADYLPKMWADAVVARFNVLAEAAGECVGMERAPRRGDEIKLYLYGPEYADAGLPDGRRAIGEAAALTEVARVAADLAAPEALRADARDGLLAAALLARAFARALPEGPARFEAERALQDVLAAAAAAVEG